MGRNVRTYGHFCIAARALEQVGDRWSLLVIRDLLTGPKRFTDLMQRLGGITPKTLSQRLRELTDEGIVTVDREVGRREVWYELTPAGSELAPVLDALRGWGLRHAWRRPEPGEPVHIEHLLRALAAAIEQAAPDAVEANWLFEFPDGRYAVHSSAGHWSLMALTGPDATVTSTTPDVTVAGTVPAFRQFLVDPPARGAQVPGLEVSGDKKAVTRFLRLTSAFTDIWQQPDAEPPPI